MKLGISSYTYTWAVGVEGHLPSGRLEAEDLLERAGELGVRVVQIADNLPLHLLPRSRLESLKREADQRGIAVEVGARGIARDHLSRCLEIAKLFASPILRVVIDAGDDRPEEEEAAERLRAAIGQLEEAGICLAIENHDRFSSAALARIVRSIGSERVGVCLDTVNSFGALEGPDVVIAELAPLAVNLHVKDFDIRRVPSGMGFAVEGRPAGRGRLDVPRLLETLRACGRDPSAILELWTPPAETPEETVRREREWAEESIRYLRRLIPD
ncbi:MAG: sugar phosphate isomerase/epimerase [Planctomycetes bacterium]|nr:sugar phosphate isomerase/epimerase [Planctomycetota bacterium]